MFQTRWMLDSYSTVVAQTIHSDGDVHIIRPENPDFVERTNAEDLHVVLTCNQLEALLRA